jgi:hypothetical protein
VSNQEKIGRVYGRNLWLRTVVGPLVKCGQALSKPSTARGVQTTAIVLAGVWALYTFVYKEILLPKSAPVNVSIDLQLKKIESTDQQSNQLVCVEMAVKAVNPSSRVAHLLPSVWFAHGCKIGKLDSDDGQFRDNLSTALGGSSKHSSLLYFQQKHFSRSNWTFVGGGGLFEKRVLKPSEAISFTLILSLPLLAYDVLRVEAHIPTVGDADGIEGVWSIDKDGPRLDVNRVGKDNKPILIEIDAKGSYPSRLNFDEAHTISEISLFANALPTTVAQPNRSSN